MNNLCELYTAYLEECNIYGEVKEFRKRECHSENFQTIMDWLKETITLSGIAQQNKVVADLNVKTATKAIKIKVKPKNLAYHIYSWEWYEPSNS